MFLGGFYVLMAVVIVGFAITQMIIPITKNEPLFPLFRKRQELRKELIVEEEHKKVATLERDVKTLKKQTRNYEEDTDEESYI